MTTKMAALLRHVNKYKNETCNVCNISFKCKSSLSRHMKIYHDETYKTMMKIKRQGIKQKISDKYKTVVSEVLYSSDSDCEYELLQTVVRIKTTLCDAHVCKICRKRFTKFGSLAAHLTKHTTSTEEISTNYTEELVIDANETNDDDIKPKYSCKMCDRTFKYACSLTNHKRFHTKQTALLATNDGSYYQIKTRRHRCLMCNKMYSQKIHLDNHMSVHRGENVVAAEKNDSLYTCLFCGEGFAVASRFSAHLSLHVNKPHLCSICGKSFSVKRYLIVHQRTHTQEKSFSCHLCRKGFIHKNSLVEHQRIHDGIKPHTCSTCNKKFTHYSGLTQHLKIHTDEKKHVCTACGKAFRFGGHFREHMRIHSGDRPFVCNTCNKAFTSKSCLNVHLRTHSGERPFRCNVCKKGFIKSYGLLQHRKTHSACNETEIKD